MTASTNELMACELAARLRDGEVVIVGGASPVPMAAALLAQHTTAPNLTLLTGSGAVNPRPARLPRSGGDYDCLATAEAYFTMDDVFDDTERGRWDVGIFGGIQIDRFGNFNLTFVGGSLESPVFRGPGLVNAGIPSSLARSMLCVERHTADVFVERIDFVSGAGTRRPDGRDYPAARRGGGPDFCVTPLASMDFSDDARRLTLRSVHPGVESETVRERTGFTLAGPSAPPVTAEPPPDRLDVLRRRVDPAGALRGAPVTA